MNKHLRNGLPQVLPLGNRKRRTLKQLDQKVKPPLQHQVYNNLHKPLFKQLVKRTQPPVLCRNKVLVYKRQKLAKLLRSHPPPRRLRHKKIPKLLAPKQLRTATDPLHNKRHIQQVPLA